MTYLLWCLLGVAIGSIIVGIIFFMQSTCGALKIDRTNPEKDIYRIEIEDLDKMSKKKRVILKVDVNSDFSQK